jgi:hypothetical protein
VPGEGVGHSRSPIDPGQPHDEVEVGPAQHDDIDGHQASVVKGQRRRSAVRIPGCGFEPATLRT